MIVICSRQLVIIALVPVVGGNGGGQQEIDERDDEGSGRITRDQVSDGGRHEKGSVTFCNCKTITIEVLSSH